MDGALITKIIVGTLFCMSIFYIVAIYGFGDISKFCFSKCHICGKRKRNVSQVVTSEHRYLTQYCKKCLKTKLSTK